MSSSNYKPLKYYEYLLVEHQENDLIGKFLAYISLTPFLLIIGAIGATYYSRSLKLVIYNVGLLISLKINSILKNQIFQQARPDFPHQFKMTSFGMPSDHTQCIAFMTVTFILYSIEALGLKNSGSSERREASRSPQQSQGRSLSINII